jgi:NAD(P)-dependent dehydrogenase (short-subunit alcohol dehydrogenase family)
MTDLKTVVITGGNTGLGFACASHICESQTNWHVVLACRNEVKAQQAVEKIIAETGNQNIGFQKLDLSSLQSVREFVSTFLKGDSPPLHGLICNAGISLGDEITTTPDGIETTFQVNCLGHFLLANLLLPHLKKPSRILFVSSELHRNDGSMKSFRPDFKSAKDMAYPEKPLSPIKNWGSKRYSETKLCLLFYTYELARQLSLKNTRSIAVNAFNPGLMPDTGLGGLNKMYFTKFFLKYILPIFSKGAVSTPEISGRILAELLVDDKYQDVTGKYFDRDKIIPSSEESYDKLKWLDLWNSSLAMAGIDPQSTFPTSTS